MERRELPRSSIGWRNPAFGPVRSCSAAFAAFEWLRRSECSVLFGYVRFWTGWSEQVRKLRGEVCALALAFTAAVRWRGPGSGRPVVIGNVHNIALAFDLRRSDVLSCTQVRAGDVNSFAHGRTARIPTTTDSLSPWERAGVRARLILASCSCSHLGRSRALTLTPRIKCGAGFSRRERGPEQNRRMSSGAEGAGRRLA